MIGDSFDRVEHALEERGCNPRGNVDRGLKALCPAHDDRNPSLGVAHRDGKTLVKCYAGCETTAILDALALRWSDLFDDALAAPSGAGR